jgi:hypothetical protein
MVDHDAIQGVVPTSATAISPATVRVERAPPCVLMKVDSFFVLRCILYS